MKSTKDIKDVQVKIDLTEISPKKAPKKASSIEETASRYISLKAKISKMEAECKALAPALKAKAYKGKQDGNTFVAKVGRFEVVVTEASRESFNLKSAREVLQEAILKPHIKVSSYDVLRIKAVE